MRNYILTIQSLIKNPEEVFVRFLSDSPSAYRHPFFCLVFSAILSAVLMLPGSYWAVFPSFQPDGIPEEEIAQIIGVWIGAADFRAFTQFLPLLMAFLLTPALALAGVFFYREKIPGFYRNLVVSGYLMSLVVLSQIFLIPVWYIAGEAYTTPTVYRYLPAIIAGIVLLRGYHQILKENTMLMWIRSASVITSGYVLFVFIAVFVNSVAGYMAFAVNRILDVVL